MRLSPSTLVDALAWMVSTPVLRKCLSCASGFQPKGTFCQRLTISKLGHPLGLAAAPAANCLVPSSSHKHYQGHNEVSGKFLEKDPKQNRG